MRVYLCKECDDRGWDFWQKIGDCELCKAFSAAPEFKLCLRCAAQTGKCQKCQKVVCSPVATQDDVDNLRNRHDDLARRVFDLETENAIVGALEDTVRLLVAEVAELRAKFLPTQ